jgi:hypothetical protein
MTKTECWKSQNSLQIRTVTVLLVGSVEPEFPESLIVRMSHKLNDAGVNSEYFCTDCSNTLVPKMSPTSLFLQLPTIKRAITTHQCGHGMLFTLVPR